MRPEGPAVALAPRPPRGGPRRRGGRRARRRANAAFLGDVFAGAVNDTGVLYEVAAPLLVPGGRVAYLPNAGRRDPLLCGDTAPLRHVKFLRKADRDLDARCGAPPPGLLFKGD